MTPETKMALWVLTGLFAITTVFFNIYIFYTTVWSLHGQKKGCSPSDTIMVALSAASVLHQLLSYCWMTMDEVDMDCYVAATPYTVLLLLVYSLKSTLTWDTGFLTFYYSNKLVSGAHRCCGHVQTAILRHVTAAVLLIPLCSLGACMPMLAVFRQDNRTTDHKDCGVLVPSTAGGRVYEVAYLVLVDVLPGLVLVKCCVSISAHLALHLRDMKASTNGAHGPKLGSQMRVIRMALSLVAVFAVFLVVDLYVQYQIATHHENIITLTFFFTSIYTTATAMVLIYGKKTLWKSLLREFNVFLDEFPCLSSLKVPEGTTKSSVKS
ncbi:uncharacterized protein V6R79_019909 [Siganus canaliculatus]